MKFVSNLIISKILIHFEGYYRGATDKDKEHKAKELEGILLHLQESSFKASSEGEETSSWSSTKEQRRKPRYRIEF